MIRAASLVLLFLSLPATADNLTGKATLVDGDTIEIGEQVIHLHGIDAPEMDQFCTDKKSKRFNSGMLPCGGCFSTSGPIRLTVPCAQNEMTAASRRAAWKSYFPQNGEWRYTR